MAKISLIFFVSMFYLTNAMATLSIEGVYQGKNLYVQNPMDVDGFGYCGTKVTVNGDVMPGGTNVAAFPIDFSQFNIAIGDPVFIVIEHNDGCKPKILNPEVLLPKSTYKVNSISISPDGRLVWESSLEKGKLPYIIEQYRWNKWVAIGEVQGIGTEGANKYEFQVSPHSGENSIRVAQFDHTGKGRYSSEVKFKSVVPVVSKKPAIVKDKIEFFTNGKPVETRYEIYDAYGNIVKKGVGSLVNCTNLVKGVYYINYDNINEKFIKN
jgi:hypothetical protein|tara:strand:+ start:27173 stop:27973 length:801 start_codon:yes stop_codon:yes gene_type:complete